jgi:hypothetical protein
MLKRIIEVMVEVLTVLGIATMEIKQGRMSELFSTSMSRLTEQRSEKLSKKVIGRTDMEDALKRLDKLTHEEARMATAEVLRATHGINERMRSVDNRVDDKAKEQTANDVDQVNRSSSPNPIGAYYGALHIISENQIRENIHKWLSPPNPSTNHNIACDTHHKKTATWFFQSSIFQLWKSTGLLLWIHGKRVPCPTSHPIPSDEILNCSWLWQEYSLVSGCLAPSIIGD